MISLNRSILLISLLTVIVLISVANSRPGKDHAKIRIHVPIKHHTHVHTKTIIKKVPVPVPIPVKEEKHHHHLVNVKHYKGNVKHYKEEEEDEDDFDGYVVPKIKKRRHHPFM